MSSSNWYYIHEGKECGPVVAVGPRADAVVGPLGRRTERVGQGDSVSMPGRAQGVALYLDRMKDSNIIGTVAGDDSIIVVPDPCFQSSPSVDSRIASPGLDPVICPLKSLIIE